MTRMPVLYVFCWKMFRKDGLWLPNPLIRDWNACVLRKKKLANFTMNCSHWSLGCVMLLYNLAQKLMLHMMLFEFVRNCFDTRNFSVNYMQSKLFSKQP